MATDRETAKLLCAFFIITGYVMRMDEDTIREDWQDRVKTAWELADYMVNNEPEGILNDSISNNTLFSN